VAVSVWMDDYEKNKLEILALLPTSKWATIKEEVSWLFKEFEENGSSYTPDERVEALDWIWNKIVSDYKKNKREWENDFNLYFCDIFRYYDITSTTGKCWASMEIKSVQKNYQESKDNQSSWERKWGLPTWLKIMLIVLVWWVLTMVWVIVFFSIKARLNSSSDNEEDEW
jgi:hypothetical protein